MSEHKFQCGKCGQRLAATSDEVGLAANCPACGVALIIPAPAAVPQPPADPPSPAMAGSSAQRRVSSKLAAAIAATKAFGLTYRDPDWVDEKGEEHTVKAIDGFFAELYRLTDLLHSMEAAGEIVHLPDAEELQAIRVLLFEAFLRGKYGGTEEELKAFIVQGAPGVQAG